MIGPLIFTKGMLMEIIVLGDYALIGRVQTVRDFLNDPARYRHSILVNY